MKIILVLAFVALATADYNPGQVQTLSLGTAMTHTLGKLASLPMMTMDASGFRSSNKCQEGLGMLYEPEQGFSSKAPLGIYYTAAG